MKNIANDDIKNYLNLSTAKNGIRKVKWKDLTQVDTRNISELTIEKGVLKFKRYSRDTALFNLGKHLGLFDSTAKASLEKILLDAYTAGTIQDDHLQKIAALIIDNNKNNEQQA